MTKKRVVLVAAAVLAIIYLCIALTLTLKLKPLGGDLIQPQFFDKPTNQRSTADIIITPGNSSEKRLKFQKEASEILRSHKLPDWVKLYAEWHKQQRQRHFDAQNRNTESGVRFLISRCLNYDKCGGASDRLQDMPYNIMIANKTKRVLLVKWERPAPLENFLVPPDGGINWTIPDGMFNEGENWNLRGREDGKDKIVSVIRRDSAAPIFRKYEVDTVGHKMYVVVDVLFIC